MALAPAAAYGSSPADLDGPPAAGEPGPEVARLDEGHPDAEGLDLPRQRLGPPLEGELAGRVVGLERQADDAADRAHQDDAAAGAPAGTGGRPSPSARCRRSWSRAGPWRRRWASAPPGRPGPSRRRSPRRRSRRGPGPPARRPPAVEASSSTSMVIEVHGSSGVARRLAPTTRNPWAVRCSAQARPMPDDAPVMRTTCSAHRGRPRSCVGVETARRSRPEAASRGVGRRVSRRSGMNHMTATAAVERRRPATVSRTKASAMPAE